MSSKLKLFWASRKAAIYAVKNWHYSRALPASSMVVFGVNEDEKFIGVVIYSLGNNRFIGHPFGLKQNEICELSRVALKSHHSSVSKIISISLRLFHQHCPNTKMVISYADTEEGHHGGIYQALNWIYTGKRVSPKKFLIKGKEVRQRTVSNMMENKQRLPQQSELSYIQKYIDPNAKMIEQKPKHKYIWVFDKKEREEIKKRFGQPYPKRRKHSDDAVGIQLTEGGLIPTPTLQLNVAANG